MEDALVSIIVPVYKVGRYVRSCLESIRNQSYTNIEVIMVVQPSQDGSEEVCREYADRDERFRYVEEEMCDLSNARNVGVREAKGEYYAFIDSDDMIHPDFVVRLLDVAKAEGVNIVQCKSYAFKDESKLRMESGLKMSAAEYGADDSKCETNGSEQKNVTLKSDENPTSCEIVTGHEMCGRQLYRGYGSDYTVVMTRLYNKAVFDAVEFPTGRMHEDHIFTVQAFWNEKRIAIIGDELYYYRSGRVGSITHTFNAKAEADAIYAKKYCLHFYEERKEQRYYEQALYLLCNGLARVRVILKKYKNEHIADDDYAELQDAGGYHAQCAKLYRKGNGSLGKKALVCLGCVSPSAWYFIWSVRRKHRIRKEWRNKE